MGRGRHPRSACHTLRGVWEFDWGVREASTGLVDSGQMPGGMVAPTFWAEHCTECAIPDCYATCHLHVPRGDGACHRFVGGIRRLPQRGRVYGSGARIRFQRWAKLQTEVPTSVCSRRSYLLTRCLDALIRKCVPPGSTGVRGRLVRAWSWRRPRLVGGWGRRPPRWSETDLCLEILNEDRPTAVTVELLDESGIGVGRVGLEVPLGRVEAKLPASSIGLRDGRRNGFVRLTVEGDAEVELAFLVLEFVERPEDEQDRSAAEPASIVKCVVWDLDETLWRGTLLHDGPDALALRPSVVDAIRILDDRGILHAVASKNDPADALPVLERLGVEEYFVAAEVSWDPKSDGLRRIAETLNIGIDSLLLVDDSEFERSEVSNRFPEVRVLDPVDLDEALDWEELNPVVLPDARERRVRYRTEWERREAAEGFDGSHVEFLRSCQMVLRLESDPRDDSVDRMVELLARTNQLNLSGRRYGLSDIERLRDNGSVWVSGACSDRFGDHGIVVAARLEDREDSFCLADLAISCRVAEKAVENALVEWIRGEALKRGATTLIADFVASERNGPLERALVRCGFAAGDKGLLVRGVANVVPYSDLVRLVPPTNRNGREVSS